VTDAMPSCGAPIEAELPIASEKFANMKTTPPEESALAQAFANFTRVAGSLERSYTQLQGEVVRLRRELEERNRELSRTRDYLDGILANLPCGVIVFDSQHRLQMANAEACRLVGAPLAAGAIWPKSLRRIFVPELIKAPMPQEWLVRVLPQDEASEAYIAVRLSDTITALPSAMVLILMDVTQTDRVEREQGKRQTSRALSEMSAILAHEIRNPLGSMELFAGLLADAAELSPESRSWAVQIQAGLRTLAATVNNVLHFHALPQSQLAFTDLGEMFDGACMFFAPMAARANVTLQTINLLRNIQILAERNGLQQVLLNLARNALQASSAGATIKMSGEVTNTFSRRCAEIKVSDTGGGIARENLDRIFEPRFSTRPGGLGLGLAVSKRIVEKVGGTIEVESELGKGSMFTVRFALS